MLENAKEVPARARESVGSWWTNLREFLTDVRSEMKRVTWPSRREVYATTVVVILTSIVLGIYLWGVDMVFNSVVGWIFRRFGAA